MTIFINIVLILISIVLIVAVLMQEGNKQGLGAIGGGAETFFGKSKAKSYEGKLILITKIAAAVFIVLAIVATIINANNGKKAQQELDELLNGDVEVTDSLDTTVETAEEAASEVVEGVEEAVEATEEAASEVVETVAEAASEAAEATVEAVEEAASEVVEATEEAASEVVEAVEEAATEAAESTEG